MTNSVNVNDSKLDDIKVDAYELGWRCTGDSVYTQLRLIIHCLIKPSASIKPI
ncbi:Ferric aerobactin receptor precursor [Erwinia amylovora]|uniref:Ferric aerobactin receptor n=2 Tax=Erwinia amylovora TaxID=552 RepID=A0A831EL20_ERWAM|nr:Ferric aerobactin receptor precursor [Erwinia amylovora ACW56400]QJQ53313.1 Ferric aerobactin receptor precursor [Erwinia amylovora]CBA22824.1 Ferric aerobactin receptor precursor [Erwinia amylovora CFBP1430]CCO79866.1 Ferric aerobactin receptor precursor [Erwinia amylovora Ea356]CCO83671.1 Ferric aerobactin receptor precursor [Erwinia amylovora Ea266]CCO87429.1 Ferric aerobactin receptor precursor [Erwinia amylovora CFBP 2585]CCO91226.1 Ferric aerobactin receptor precursor [Erwinia amylov